MKNRVKIFLLTSVVCLTGACTTIKPYERIYVDDSAMRMGASGGEAFEYYVESIREGGAQAGSGKTGGGCGCN